MLFLLFSLLQAELTWDTATQCGNMFLWRYEFCKEDPSYANLDGTGKALCSLYIPYYMPVGWYQYSDPVYSQFAFIETETTISGSGAPDVRNTYADLAMNKKKEGPHEKFNKECPMYDGVTYPNMSSCCLHKYASKFDEDYTEMFMKAESIRKQYQFLIYPKCYELIRYMPCAICHPKVQSANVSKIAGFERVDGYEKHMPVFTYRLCRNYTQLIYKYCKSAYFIGAEKRRIVPKNMGLEQFMDLMGVPELFGIPNDTCLDVLDVNPFYKE
ncbi:hypothetical protein TRFO_24277 [Tritrichomonas foetus]|uniref:Uncharacterized protein n=1 Tax=Tritrichomonas foetus TaxID=1144522 RepID=A0A1J4K7K7_9EUKA|nr:hypothetical protein TRFO_24277 [Tritrichomonas foetus]|eukprot:OHT07465.1 hypothetical protein TRFO_24277 [Tritrichomonas foetus]